MLLTGVNVMLQASSTNRPRVSAEEELGEQY